MNDTTNWKVPKWPFLVGDGLLLIFGYLLVNHSPLPGHWGILAVGCVALGTVLGVIPFILDYLAMGKALEVNALGTVAEKIQNLENLTATNLLRHEPLDDGGGSHSRPGGKNHSVGQSHRRPHDFRSHRIQ